MFTKKNEHALSEMNAYSYICVNKIIMPAAKLKKVIKNVNSVLDMVTGEVVEQDISHITHLVNSKEEFYFLYASAVGLIIKDLNGPEIKVYAYILKNYLFDSSIALNKPLKQLMAETIGIKLGTINNALSGLVDKKLIYTTHRSIYKINPRYAFKGSSKQRDALLKFVLEVECPDC